MWGISWRLNNTRQVPAARAFVSNQTGLMEERGDACDLGHLCCFASRTQQGSSRALTRHGSSFTGAPLPVRLYSLNFPTQLLGVGCKRLREWLRSRRARGTQPSTIVASTWVTVIACELFWTSLRMGLAARHCTLVITDGARPHRHRHRRAASPYWSSGDH
jgi:hypothetical protein